MEKEKYKKVMAKVCNEWVDEWCRYFGTDSVPFNDFSLAKLNSGVHDYAFVPGMDPNMDAEGNEVKVEEEKPKPQPKKPAAAKPEPKEEKPDSDENEQEADGDEELDDEVKEYLEQQEAKKQQALKNLEKGKKTLAKKKAQKEEEEYF